MPTLTTNFEFQKPLVNNATDADLWGGQLNSNWDDIDTDLAQTTFSKSSDFNVGATEFNYTYLIDASGGTVTATLPAASSVFAGFVVRFKAIDVSNTVTIDGNGSETIDGAASFTLDAEDDAVIIVCDGTNWQKVSKPTNFASTSDVETGSSTTLAVTPSALRSALGFSEEFISSNQTITSGGLLTVAHSLTGSPKIIQIVLECQASEFNWAINDQILIGFPGVAQAANRGCAVYADATNVYIRYGSDSSVFNYINKTTGTAVSLTNGNWQLIIRAWG